jgi:DNA (cytosine-5)-methyltransferase 1
MDSQMNIFSVQFDKLKIDKPIRLIELFAGYGSQALALQYLGVKFDSWKICEWNYKSFHAYRLMHRIKLDEDFSDGVSTEEITKYLIGCGISSDWNKPMSEREILALSEEKKRKIYSDILATNNLVDISKAKAESLGITDRDKYTYLMTYSFPCQDLSLAGKTAGMKKGESTRSGLLWEVERVLKECGDNSPDILIMENVTQVHGERNREEFNDWINALDDMGYISYFSDLEATDYGIPQTRDRCFMVSIKGKNKYYEFPKAFPLTIRLRDMLEENVSEKYYLSQKQIDNIKAWGSRKPKMGDDKSMSLTTRIGALTRNSQLVQVGNLYDDTPTFHNRTSGRVYDDTMSPSIRTAQGGGITPIIMTKGRHQNEKVFFTDGSSPAIIATTYKKSTMIAIKDNTKKGYDIAEPGDGVYIRHVNNKRGTVQHDKIQTINANVDVGVVMQVSSYTPSGVSGKVVDPAYSSATLTTGNHRNVEAVSFNGLSIRKLTPRECFRLMGVHDSEFDLIRGDFSDSVLYHMAGDSIVVNVLMAIFSEMF